MTNKIYRIALIGPESSGKTTLARDLASHYKTVWVPEFARGYIGNLGRKYERQDVIVCAKKQFESEQLAISSANRLLFSDTELINCSVWLKDVFDSSDEWIEETIRENVYDLYLLTSPDLPFIDDPVRENPHRREYFFEWYRRELEERKFNYSIISGIGEARIQNAITCVDSFAFKRTRS